MYPLHKEKYVISIETFYNFTYDRHTDIFKKEKRSHMINALAMFVAAIVTFIVYLTSDKVKGDAVWFILPIVFVILCATYIMRYNRADGQVVNKINLDYKNRGYAEKYHSVKFYEDRLEYVCGENKDEISYKNFRKFYEGKAYFAIYFTTGELVLMSDKCNVEKIKGIFASYKENLVKESEEV